MHLVQFELCEVMYDDYIGFFVVGFQIWSLESGIVAYLYWCRIFCGDHNFCLGVYNVVNQILADRVDQLHLVLDYIEDFLRGECCV